MQNKRFLMKIWVHLKTISNKMEKINFHATLLQVLMLFAHVFYLKIFEKHNFRTGQDEITVGISKFDNEKTKEELLDIFSQFKKQEVASVD